MSTSSNNSLFYATAGAVVIAVAGAISYLSLRKQTFPSTSTSSTTTTQTNVFLDANFPRDVEGRTFHLNVKPGEVANRVLSVGDHGRAERIASMLDSGTHKVITSTRSFVTHTGLFKGIPVSIIATGMGAPMMDFVVRETRAIVSGPMAMLRYGTCGGLGGSDQGTVVIPAEGSVLIRRDPDAVGKAIVYGVGTGSNAAATPTAVRQGTTKNNNNTSSSSTKMQQQQQHSGVVGAEVVVESPVALAPFGVSSAASPYSISKPVRPHAGLTAALIERMKANIVDEQKNQQQQKDSSSSSVFAVNTGMDATADSFYSSQGRTSTSFVDNNEALIAHLEESLPHLRSLQMETFHLLDLARSSTRESPIAASAAAIVIVSRTTGKVVSRHDVEVLETEGGRACLEALIGFDLNGVVAAAGTAA